MQPAAGPAFWPGFIPLQHDHYEHLTVYCRQHSTAQSVPFYCGLLPNTALCSPGTARSRSGARSGAPRTSNSGRYALLIEYEPTAVASTRRSIGLCCLLLVPGGWRGLVRVDRGLLAGGSWGLAQARGTIPRACA